VELHSTGVAGIANLSPLPEISDDQYDADYGSDDSLDLGSAKGIAPISLNNTELSLKQCAKRMGQPNFSAFNKWNNVWVAGHLEKEHWSIAGGLNHL
jgi:hypothetical protein